MANWTVKVDFPVKANLQWNVPITQSWLWIESESEIYISNMEYWNLFLYILHVDE